MLVVDWIKKQHVKHGRFSGAPHDVEHGRQQRHSGDAAPHEAVQSLGKVPPGHHRRVRHDDGVAAARAHRRHRRQRAVNRLVQAHHVHHDDVGNCVGADQRLNEHGVSSNAADFATIKGLLRRKSMAILEQR